MLVVEAPLSRSLSRGTRGRSSVGRRRWIVQPFGLPPFGELSVLVWLWGEGRSCHGALGGFGT
jgi:hypothetical protein